MLTLNLFVIEYGNNGGDVRCMSLQVRSAQQNFSNLEAVRS